MTIDPSKETVITFTELGRKLLRTTARGTVRDWADRGRVSVSGKRIKLETIATTWGRGTSYEAYLRFMKRINE